MADSYEIAVRGALQLLEGSVIGAPKADEHVGVWLADAIAAGYFNMLSTGERVIFDVAMSMWQPAQTVSLCHLRNLDPHTRAQLTEILVTWLNS